MNRRDDPKPKPVITPARAEARALRERRLAEALRANLKRRKEQTRGRAENSEPPSSGGDADK
ncbi:MAG TPA: hypothetical protein VIF14_15270 [Alphaproteobacteria bacterium]|jgi:hypothetical protein